MKRLLKRICLIVLAVLTFVSMFACGSSGNKDAVTTPESKADTTAAKPSDTTTKEETPAETTPAETTPAETMPAETTPVTVPEGLMVYYEDFEKLADVGDTDGAMTSLEWKVWNKSDGGLTDSTVYNYAIKNGCFLFDNLDREGVKTVDSYVMIKKDEYTHAAFNGNYTLQYDMTYTAANAGSRYALLITSFDGYNSYNTAVVRATGSYCESSVRFGGQFFNYGVPGEFHTGKDVDDGVIPSVSMRVFGIPYTDSEPYTLIGKCFTIKYVYGRDEGPSVWMRDNTRVGTDFVCIAKFNSASRGSVYFNALDVHNLALKVTPRIAGSVDNIALWTGLGEMPSDHTTTAYEAAVAAAK